MKAIDCQGFAGAFTLGIAQAGFEVVAKREEEGGFGVPLVAANKNLINPDIEIQADEPSAWEPIEVEVVIGNPPCSGFSLLSGAATEEKRFAGSESHANINECMWNLVRYAAKCKPQVVVMESVQAAYTRGRPLMLELRDEMERRTGEQYDLTHVLHNAAAVGGASNRARYFMVLSKPGLKFGIDPMPVERVVTVEDVLGDLYGQPLDPDPQPYTRPVEECEDSPAGLALRSPTGMVDGHEILRNRMSAGKAYLASMGWQPNEKSGVAFARLMAEGKMTEQDVLNSPLVHRKSDDDPGFVPTIYTAAHPFTPDRLNPKKLSPVMTGTGAQDFIHPVEHRTVTFREVARIMGWPDDWTLAPLWEAGRPAATQKWLGKGITVQVGKWIGDVIMQTLDGNPGAFRGYPLGDRERVINFTNDYKAVYRTRDGEVMDARSPKLRKEMEVERWEQVAIDAEEEASA